jgi:hypothetical protein
MGITIMEEVTIVHLFLSGLVIGNVEMMDVRTITLPRIFVV